MRLILPIIVIAQFFCTSVWFSGNAIVNDIARAMNLEPRFLAHLTSAIQFGFIAGTLVFAIFTIADRYSPSRVFFFSSILAGLFNLGINLPEIHTTGLLLFRFLTGFFLAGIYPVGMKIASDHYKEGLGKSLGFLVGALVIGTAFPHLLKTLTASFPWKYVVFSTSTLCVSGGLGILLFVPDGPYHKTGQKINFTAFLKGFRKPDFRSVAFGYFGHMWELYTFWAFVPVMLTKYNQYYPTKNLDISLLAFFIIGSGAFACVFGGLLSQKFGAKKIAAIALFTSCLCCISSPLFLFTQSTELLIAFLFIWGLSVIADSPLFSTLVAQNAPEKSRGASLTIVNCIGFTITIISIQFINALMEKISPQYVYMLLAIGPVFGLIALSKNKVNR
ncbi:MAG TPA: MFS transporter [Chitinophagaceae bacterium]|nr:MFS transporter [Chitinophagaceae bacterium]